MTNKDTFELICKYLRRPVTRFHIYYGDVFVAEHYKRISIVDVLPIQIIPFSAKCFFSLGIDTEGTFSYSTDGRGYTHTSNYNSVFTKFTMNIVR